MNRWSQKPYAPPASWIEVSVRWGCDTPGEGMREAVCLCLETNNNVLDELNLRQRELFLPTLEVRLPLA